MRNYLALGAAMLIALSASARGADEVKPPESYVVLKTDWWQPAPSLKSAYRLALSVYDPESEKLLGKPFGGGIEFAAQKKKLVEGYLIQRLKPGRWVFQSYSQQDKWALCYNAHSLQFDVKPGEIVYLGEFDANRSRQELTDEAVRHGKISIGGYDFADFFDLAEEPHFAPVTDDQLDSVREMLSRTNPTLPKQVVAARYSPASFGTGSTLFAERRCGGYFVEAGKKGAKAKSSSGD